MAFRGQDTEQSLLDDAFFLNAARCGGYNFKIRDITAGNTGMYSVNLPYLHYGSAAYVPSESMEKLGRFVVAMRDPELSAMNKNSLLHKVVHDPGTFFCLDSEGMKQGIEEIIKVAIDPRSFQVKGREAFVVLSPSCVRHLAGMLADIADHLQIGTPMTEKEHAFWAETVQGSVQNRLSIFDRLRWTKRSRPHIDEKIVPKLAASPVHKQLTAG